MVRIGAATQFLALSLDVVSVRGEVSRKINKRASEVIKTLAGADMEFVCVFD